jgi:glycerophosphoryl diester phosphodiesterase
LSAYGWDGSSSHTPVRVMSYSWASLRRVHERAPRLPTVFLMDRVPLRLRDGSLPRGTRIAGISIETARAFPHLVSRMHAQGNQVHVFTVNEAADVQLCRNLAVEAIITDRPGYVRNLLGP